MFVNLKELKINIRENKVKESQSKDYSLLFKDVKIPKFLDSLIYMNHNQMID